MSFIVLEWTSTIDTRSSHFLLMMSVTANSDRGSDKSSVMGVPVELFVTTGEPDARAAYDDLFCEGVAGRLGVGGSGIGFSVNVDWGGGLLVISLGIPIVGSVWLLNLFDFQGL